MRKAERIVLVSFVHDTIRSSHLVHGVLPGEIESLEECKLEEENRKSVRYSLFGNGVIEADQKSGYNLPVLPLVPR